MGPGTTTTSDAMLELVYASAPRTLEGPGYGAVGRSPAFPSSIESEIGKQLNQYDLDPELNPEARPIYSCVRFGDSRHGVRVLSRVGHGGIDYSERIVFFAHHIVLPDSLDRNPAALMTDASLFQKTWNGYVGAVPHRRLPSSNASVSSGHWRRETGSDDWASEWIAMTRNRVGSGPLFLLASKSADLLRLFAEAAQLMTPTERRNLTFITDLASERRGLRVDWVGLRAGSKFAALVAAQQPERTLDLRTATGKRPSTARPATVGAMHSTHILPASQAAWSEPVVPSYAPRATVLSDVVSPPPPVPPIAEAKRSTATRYLVSGAVGALCGAICIGAVIAIATMNPPREVVGAGAVVDEPEEGPNIRSSDRDEPTFPAPSTTSPLTVLPPTVPDAAPEPDVPQTSESVPTPTRPAPIQRFVDVGLLASRSGQSKGFSELAEVDSKERPRRISLRRPRWIDLQATFEREPRPNAQSGFDPSALRAAPRLDVAAGTGEPLARFQVEEGKLSWIPANLRARDRSAERDVAHDVRQIAALLQQCVIEIEYAEPGRSLERFVLTPLQRPLRVGLGSEPPADRSDENADVGSLLESMRRRTDLFRWEAGAAAIAVGSLPTWRLPLDQDAEGNLSIHVDGEVSIVLEPTDRDGGFPEAFILRDFHDAESPPTSIEDPELTEVERPGKDPSDAVDRGPEARDGESDEAPDSALERTLDASEGGEEPEQDDSGVGPGPSADLAGNSGPPSRDLVRELLLQFGSVEGSIVVEMEPVEDATGAQRGVPEAMEIARFRTE